MQITKTMKKKLAIIIPSVKPYDITCRLAVDSIIKSINKNPICEYKIYIYGPNNPNDDRVVFLKEERQSGENVAINQIISLISNDFDYIFLTADDFVVDEDSILTDAISLLEGELFKERKMKICTLATTLNSPCFSPSNLPFPEGSPFGRIYAPDSFTIPSFMICRFPFISKDTLVNYLNNRIFPDGVYSGYGDSCLSYFLLTNDEPCIEASNIKLHFMESVHDLDRVSRRQHEWINLRSISCIAAHNYIKNYKKGNKYV